jgi:hypothetical protein
LQWLLSGEASSGWDFGAAVAAVESTRTLLARLGDIAPAEIRDDRFIGGYLLHLVEHGDADIVNELLDRWAKDPARVDLAATLTHRLGGSPKGIARLTTLLADRALPGAFLNRLVLGFFCRDSSPEEVLRLIDASQVDQSEDARRGRLHLLQQYSSEREDESPTLEALRNAAEAFVDATWNTMDEHVWNEATSACYEKGSAALAQFLFRVFRTKSGVGDHSSARDLRTKLAEAVAALAEGESWTFFVNHLGPALAEDPSLAVALFGRLTGGSFLGSFDAEKVVSWIAKDVEHRAWPVAHSAPLDGTPMPPLARALLIKWGGRNDVRSALSATFGTGSWSGPSSDYYRSRVDLLREWEKDPAAQVRLFARTLRESYEQRTEMARKQEAERDW